MNKHKTRWLKIGNKSKRIDIDMLSLIEQLNKLGLKTSSCCHGDVIHKRNSGDFAYVTIDFVDNQYFEFDFERNQLCIRWNRSDKKYLQSESYVQVDGWVHKISDLLKGLKR